MAQNLRAGEPLGASQLPPDAAKTDEQSIARLVGDIVEDAQKLVRQEIALARVELNQEWVKAKSAARGYAGALGLAFATVFLAGITLAQILIALGVASWLSYSLVTIAFGAVAYVLVRKGTEQAKKIDFVPRQAVETMKENVQWIRNQT